MDAKARKINGQVFVYCFALFLFCNNLQAQDSLIMASLGDPGSEEMEAIIQTNDGKIMIAGITDSYSGNGDALLIKMDKMGNIEWAKTYGGSANDMALDIKQTPDNGYIVSGWTQSFGAVSYDFWVFKTDDTGNVEWEYRYGGNGADQSWSVDIDNDDYLITGGTDSFGAGLTDVWVLKLDPVGAIVWQNAYGGTGEDAPPGPYDEYVARGIVDKQGQYVISSSTDSEGHGETDIWTAQLNAGDGSIIWQFAYGDEDEDGTWSFAESDNGGYFLSGNLTDPINYDSDLWVLLIDNAGNITWQKTFGMKGKWDEALISAGMPGGDVLLGSYIEQSASDWIATLLKVDSNGYLVWANKYKTGNLDWTNAVTHLDDGTIAFAGVTIDTTTWNEDLLFVRSDSSGNVGNCNYISAYSPNIVTTNTSKMTINMTVTNTSATPQVTSSTVKSVTPGKDKLCALTLSSSYFLESNKNNIQVYPNPTLGNLRFVLPDLRSEKAELKIYNILGKEVYQSEISIPESEINTDLPSGLYLVIITDTYGKVIASEKLIFIK